VNWKPGGSVPLPAAGLKPGLYRLALLTASGDADAEAWILAGSPASYAANAAEFQQAIETTSKWAEELDRTAVRPALRTFLLSLAPGGMHEPGTR
jgi:hypothetical protein